MISLSILAWTEITMQTTGDKNTDVDVDDGGN